METHRGLGYCDNVACEHYLTGVFLLNHSHDFCCPRCKMFGFIEMEDFSPSNKEPIFNEVRLEFNFDPLTCVYKNIAIVHDESLPYDFKANVMTVKNPLVKTEQRALKLAEIYLGVLACHGDVDISRWDVMVQELASGGSHTVLDFSVPLDEFKQRCYSLEKRLERSALKRGKQ